MSGSDERAEWRRDGRRAVAALREGVDLARDEEITFLAAAIAYYAFVSLLPALLIALAIASAVGGEALVDRVLAGSEEFLTPSGQAVVEGAIENAAGRTGATIVGTVVLLWSTLRVFRGLDVAFSRIYGTTGRGSILDQVRDAAVVLISVGVGLWVMLGVGVVLAAVPFGNRIFGLLALLLGLGLAFLPLYYVFPDADVGIVEVLPGTGVAAVGWVGLQAAFQVYARAAPRYELYGVIGGVLLLLTWFYLAAVVILLGGVVNATLADRQGQGPGPRD